MDYNDNEQNIYHDGNKPNAPLHFPGAGMAAASLFLGIGAVFTTLTVFLPLALGGFAILFALLSKGYGKKMVIQAKVGMGCALAGIGATAFMFISSFVTVFSNPDILVEIGQQYDTVCEDMYGQSSEELFGYSFEDILGEYADRLR